MTAGNLSCRRARAALRARPKMVLFTSVRPLERAENLRAVYDAYDGPKQFVQRDHSTPIEGMHSGKYRLMVTDGLIEDSPGKYLWIGHGMGAGKKIGLQHPTAKFKGSSLVTYAIASSEEMIPIVAGFCGISEEQVIPLGMPRTDAYFNTKKTEAPYKRHLYAPTFRAGRWDPDLNLVWRLLPEGHRFIFKPHMVTGNRWESYWPNVEIASAHVPSTQYLVDADTVITDYSSIMFDAMVLRKPVILFAKDKDKYLRERGMYYKYPQMYSRMFCADEGQLIASILNAEWTARDEELRSFYAGACDGHSTERTLELIRSCL